MRPDPGGPGRIRDAGAVGLKQPGAIHSRINAGKNAKLGSPWQVQILKKFPACLHARLSAAQRVF